MTLTGVSLVSILGDILATIINTDNVISKCYITQTKEKNDEEIIRIKKKRIKIKKIKQSI